MSKDQNESAPSSVSRASSVPPSTASSTSTTKRSQPPHPLESPAKKQSKWSPEEDAMIIDLRQRGMKWEDISKRLPGRSAISCRLHYQNYLERRSEWDEERKNKLARLYERFKPEMWAKIAEEMAVPWRAAEAMHWQLGEQDMARRAGVVPFSFSGVAIEPPAKSRRVSNPSIRTKRDAQSRSAPQQLPSVAAVTSQAMDLASPEERPPESMQNSPRGGPGDTPQSQSWGNSPPESLNWR